MNPEELKKRSKRFAARVLRVVDSLSKTVTGNVLAHQIARSGTSAAANYRSACKARSKAEFISKMGVAEEEADETQFWLEMIVEARLMSAKRLEPLHQEAGELTAIFASSRKTASGK